MSAISFDARTEYITFTDTALDGWDSLTLLMLIRPNATASGTAKYFASKSGTGGLTNKWSVVRVKGSDPTKIAFRFDRLTTASEFETTGLLNVGSWYWVGILDDVSAGPRCFVGTPDVRPTEASYNVQTTGVGAGAADALTPIIGGQYWTFTLNDQGKVDIAFMAAVDRRMSAGELLTHWPDPQKFAGSGWKIFSWPGDGAALDAIDWSGNVLNGAVNAVPTLVSTWPGRMPRHFSRRGSIYVPEDEVIGLDTWCPEMEQPYGAAHDKVLAY